MATKYAGQNALNKLMQLVKTALASKADKTNATTSAAGLMSAADKTKLDGIAAGATKITVDSELSSSSANPVMNGTITVALSGKADKSDLSGKLDKAGGVITGNLKVDGDFEPVKGLTTSGGVYAQTVSTLVLDLHDNGTAGASACINVAGADAVEVTVPDGDKRAKARLKIGTPTEDEDATTKAYVDSKIAAGGVTVDTELSSTSTNPVQNKVVKGALDAKAEKTALDGKLDVTGGTMTGDLTVSGAYIKAKSLDNVGGDIKADGAVSAYNFVIDTGVGDKMAIFKTGDTAAAFRSTPGADYIRFAVGTPTGGNDATTKDYVDNKVSGLQTADQVQAAISSAITGVYTPKGSIAFASLPTAAAGNKGWVYNVTGAFTTTAAFVEGAGHSYGAGTNVVCVDAGSGSYKWDVLAGTIDLTELTADEVQTLWNSI